jgi:putative inorganic carbon (hco3(-)) transporter
MEPVSKSPLRKTILRPGNPVNILFGLVILAYIIIPTVTPNLKAFDTNAPKFVALACVNLLAFLALLTEKEIRQQPASLGNFFKTRVGLVYAGFLAACLLSFFNAINVLESVIQMAKVFTAFSAVFILSVIFMRDLRYLKWIIILVTLMLLFDSISVFYFITRFIRGSIADIVEIKSIYSNKNILASAIFVKLPFALWLMMYREKWLRWMGWLGLMTGITAVFFMATRAFYLGLLVLTAIYLAYMLAAYLREKQKIRLRLAGYYLAALVMAYLAFTGTQQFLYPKNNAGRLTQGVGQQLATLNTSDASINARIQSWKWSFDLLMEKPLLGVGSGNWKVVVLKYENKEKPDFQYLYKAHNDFIEIAAETGFIGGLLYLCIFALVAWAFLRQILTRGREEEDLFRYLFLSASGLAFYSVDAFFNFPADRPEILLLFSFYLAAGISVIYHLKVKSGEVASLQKPVNVNRKLLLPSGALAIVILAVTAWILGLNFKSSKTQRIVFQEVMAQKMRTSSDKIIAGFPFIPNLTILSEPINVQKARYLIEEDKDDAALAILRPDRASPWDGRREYFMAMAFTHLKQTDSALFYSEKLGNMKPNYAMNILHICQLLELQKESQKVPEYLDTYLEHNKQNSQLWTYAAVFYVRTENVEKAWQVIQEAKKYLPNDTLVDRNYYSIYQRKYFDPDDPYRADLTIAVEEMNKKNYAVALQFINRYISNVPDDFDAHHRRAYIYYYQGNYRQCVDEISYTLTLSGTMAGNTGKLINLRGVCYYELNDKELACKDFETSMKMGNNDGKTNYDMFCKVTDR